MKKIFLMGAVLLLSAALTFAQDTNSSSSNSGQTGATASSQSGTTGASSQTSTPADQTGTTTTTQQTTTTTEQTTSGNAIRGCLSGSSGNWILTDSTGVSYKLLGSDSQMSENANKEVEVMGTPGTSASASASNSPDNSAGASAGATGNPSDNTGAAGNSTAHASASSTKTLDVTSLRKVADSCSNMNQTAPQQ
jgi:ABC-type oligopeptide transport system substrate-binding subunit